MDILLGLVDWQREEHAWLISNLWIARSLHSLLKVLRTNPGSIPSPRGSHNPSIRSPLLESHLNSCRSLYKTSPQELRKNAEAALVKFNEELDVLEDGGS